MKTSLIIAFHLSLLFSGGIVALVLYLFAYAKGWNAAEHYFGEIYPPLKGPDHDLL